MQVRRSVNRRIGQVAVLVMLISLTATGCTLWSRPSLQPGTATVTSTQIVPGTAETSPQPGETPIPQSGTPSAASPTAEPSSPVVSETATRMPGPGGTPTPAHTGGWAPYGTSYVITQADQDVAAALDEVHELGIRTIVQVMDLSKLEFARAILDAAQARDMKVVFTFRDSGADWNWNGQSFDFSKLTPFIAQMGDHSALLAISGLSEPWERFSAGQLELFYQQFHQVAGDVPLWHGLDHARPFQGRICDYCVLTSSPFRLDLPADWNLVQNKIGQGAQLIRQLDPLAEVWVYAGAYQSARGHRLPTEEELLKEADLLLGDFHLDGLVWYPWHQRIYQVTLGQQPASYLWPAVRQVYDKYFGP
jgi:hypothetical protein